MIILYNFFEGIKIYDCLLIDFSKTCNEILESAPIKFDTTMVVLSRNLSDSILLRDYKKFNSVINNLKIKNILADDELIESFIYRVMAYINFKSDNYDILQKYNLVVNIDQDHNEDFINLYRVLLERGFRNEDDELLYYYLVTFLNRYINDDYEMMAQYISIIEEAIKENPVDIIYYTIDNIKNNRSLSFKSSYGYNFLL